MRPKRKSYNEEAFELDNQYNEEFSERNNPMMCASVWYT